MTTTRLDTGDALYLGTAGYSRRAPRTKTRVYPDAWVYPEGGEPQGQYSARGEDPEVDRAWDRYNRATARLTRLAVERRLYDLGYPDVKVRYSKHAGCSCPCSPGFVADRLLERDGFGTVTDLFLRDAS